MIESMDDAVGTLLDTLDRLGIADNTIIVFASDNGGNMYNEVDETTATSNTPLRGGKATMYEGGVRGPAIVAYPSVVRAGSRSDEIIQSIDFYPTLLELLGINARPNESFDGISILPALRCQPLRREAIFTYFPHAPAVPDWLPPSVSVHAGEWKLIRIFYGGEQGKHRYKLFNLREDQSETKDLVADYPDRVKELDRLIEAHLADANAVVPLPNPRFDPTKYHAELEGVGKIKSSQTPPSRKSRNKTLSPPVAGWRAAGTCTISLHEGTLVVSSDGGDPHLSFALPKSAKSDALVMTFTMSSDSRGTAQVFWQEEGVSPAFHRDRSKPLVVKHDGEPHQYSVKWSAENPVSAVRIDPSTSTGRMVISNINLTTGDGKDVYVWEL
jgi:hypothetical protein